MGGGGGDTPQSEKYVPREQPQMQVQLGYKNGLDAYKRTLAANRKE